MLVALSGGVDSAVAAALLLESGHRVRGITFLLGDPPAAGGLPPGDLPRHAEMLESAREIAATLGIPHEVADLRERFAAEVITHFCREYCRGRTPNPCVVCNRRIKFEALRRRAGELSIPHIATGHYARIEPDAGGGRHLLKKGLDRSKDQSYMLYNLTQEQLACCLFPLGSLGKGEVRARARALGLVAADRRESQEICFIPGDDYRTFLAQRGIKAEAGPIVDRSGRVLGRHAGIPFYTVGQRRGLGLGGGRRLHVLEIHPEDNRIVVGERGELYSGAAELGEMNLIAMAALEREERVGAKIRYRAPEVPARLVPLPPGPRVRLIFEAPQAAVAPGQAAVFYRGELVLGGGVITAAYDPDGSGNNS